MKKKITKRDLIILLNKSQNTDLAIKYKTWSKLDNNDQIKLIHIGTVEVVQENNKEYSTKENYWSPNYPIALEYYPYFGCDIYSDGKSYFFVYLEFGGNAPEKRCRSIKKELLV